MVKYSHCIIIKVTERGMVASKKVLPKEGVVTRSSIQEYADAVRSRYRAAGRNEKGKILDEFARVTGLHRKAVIRLLNRDISAREKKRRGCRKQYGIREREALIAIWEASDRLCSKRLKPFIPEMIKVMRRHGILNIDASVEAGVCRMSTSTIDRLLGASRRTGGRKGLSTTKAGSLLKSSIPIRTFADWTEDQPGFLEIDLVAHCGDSVDGFYLNTLCAVDVYSGWTECLPVLGKVGHRVRTAVHKLRKRMPVTVRGIDSDNGSEFINHEFYTYCRQEKITFTRSRSYKKNDSCHVEQKNGNIVRRIVGYDRYASKKAYESLERLYSLVRLYVNFFQPTMKLVSKTRHGAKVHKVYEEAKTPYQRLVESGVLTESKIQELTAIYSYLNPVSLLHQINENLEYLWKQADRTARFGNRNYDSTRRSSVTV